MEQCEYYCKNYWQLHVFARIQKNDKGPHKLPRRTRVVGSNFQLVYDASFQSPLRAYPDPCFVAS